MKAIYKMNCDCGRMGTLEGVFIAEQEHVKILLENKIRVYFGEVLGKHSGIERSIDPAELEMISANPEHVQLLESLDLSSGYNPFLYPCYQANEYGLDGNDRTVQEVVEFILEQEKRNV